MVATEPEQLVRRDVGSTDPLSYQIIGAPGIPTTRSFVSDVALLTFGGHPSGLFSVELELPGRRAWLTADVARKGKVSFLGSLRCVAAIDKPVAQDGLTQRRTRLFASCCAPR